MKSKVFVFIFVYLVIFPLLLAVRGFGADVDKELNFFRGKVVTVIVTTKPGGGYDAYGRMMARFLQKHLPGSTVIVKNVAGAGHIIGANDLYFSKPNGLTIGVGNFKGLIFTQLAKQEGVKFDLTKFSWLANVASEPQTLIVDKRTPFKTVKDLQNSSRPIRMGTSGVGSSSYNYTLMIGKALGINFKVIPGFYGSEADLAMLRGELDGQIGAYDNLRPLVENEGARVVLIVGKKKMSQFPDVPLISAFSTPKTKGLIDLMIATAELGRPIAAPPNMPPLRLKALREAIRKTFHDPELLAYSEKAKLPVSFMSGEETARLFVNALNQSPEIVKMVKELTKID